uniref:CID domain-containing protein n=1 Tax=Macrostomum lignano TaxID=282301 RepID=A0A1I8IE22_9PLAT
MLASQGIEKEQNSAVSVDELLVDFEKTLIDTLKAPEKNVIGNLTGMVDGYLSRKDSAAICPRICKIIERRLNEVQVNRKLAHLYLMDSIVKNFKTSQYPKLFGANLVQNFANVFRKGDEKMRKKLFELRKTWPEHFSQSVLHSLDLAVREIDPAWPILAPQPPEQQQQQQNGSNVVGVARKRCHSPDSPDSTTTQQQQQHGLGESSSRKRMSVANPQAAASGGD